ncbi:MAG: 50S ribosomal protein L23 [Zetaproteobacteria bacterium CG12_big_fil_rev_8_21_14_0_65_54_13]|nr:MAG: 50S ribosomal protein L23 [Zetaproteobacteria bacterium CG23_combo_of_CG06-09_8_20_14_all_54_7]PIW49109.1 MAG: 50S ribosomal protein L23 [Zetaproteobacteria bacterium CG12_big_fil_rev_8_21_14_0_65_54_13]PIX55896.1 MAG: 50S ribosomal protein L23 [Zetaproteobacteria bacterium CG_4_10_14_3_um_filter_54_28]PJA30492.1 MAG: 50S ribosomal protein L23 [Zetaproteobacteria bacterium CG_4_9_14_3_um_filter_54_145]
MSANINHFNILRQPVITEKSYTATGAANQYTFRIAREASKTQVKAAIEAIFEVDVDKVQVINMPSKPKRRGAHAGSRSGYRKAVVRLAEGQTLEVAEEV